jgi:hypothetical protein
MMVGPIPSPENYQDSMRDSPVKTKYKSYNGRPVPVDPFDRVTERTVLDIHKFANGKNTVSPIIEVFGCKGCRWINTDLCPHRDNGVTHLKHHANGICSQRWKLPFMLHNEGVTMTGKQMLQVKGLMDAEFFSKYIQDAALKGTRDINDLFGWEKLKADILKDMRKQDEGSKLTVARSGLDDLRKTISINPKVDDVKTIGDDFNELRKEIKEEVNAEDIADDINSTQDDLTDISIDNPTIDVVGDDEDE